jgi:hypothetical protein
MDAWFPRRRLPEPVDATLEIYETLEERRLQQLQRNDSG